MREQLRIQNLQELIVNNIVKVAPLHEWSPKIPISDLRTYKSSSDPCVFVLGGMIGELLMTLSSINDYMIAVPNQNNSLSHEVLDHYLTVLMSESVFPRESIMLELTHDPSLIQGENGELE